MSFGPYLTYYQLFTAVRAPCAVLYLLGGAHGHRLLIGALRSDAVTKLGLQVYFSDRGRRDDLFYFRVLCRKVWRRLKAEALWCASAGSNGPGGDGHRLQINSEPDVLEFVPYASVDSGTSAGSGPLHRIHAIDEDEVDGTPYQLMVDDDTGS